MLRVLNSAKNEFNAVFSPFSQLKPDNNKRNRRASQLTWKNKKDGPFVKSAHFLFQYPVYNP